MEALPFVYQPSSQSPIYWQDHSVVMPNNQITTFVQELFDHDNDQAAWLRSIAPSDPCTLVDVGSNVGLFTRQALIAIPSIVSSYVYEPDNLNFECLKKNLSPWKDSILRTNAALSDEKGNVRFFKDQNNFGNYSLLQSAMADSPFSQRVVAALEARTESYHWIDADLPILYKSDTQGMDEKIATLVYPMVWDRIFAASFEIWRIEKPAYDVEAFRAILARFSNRRFLGSEKQLTIDEVLAFSSGRDGTWLDLVLTR